MSNQLKKQDFIDKATKKFDKKFDYSLVIYVNARTLVIIRCLIHECNFEAKPTNHLSSHNGGCKKCLNRVNDKESFIKKATEKHGNRYDYSKVTNFNNSKEKLIIKCIKHNFEFLQSSNEHLTSKRGGCKYCSNREVNDTESFKKKAIEIHGKRYDYSLVKYKDTYTLVKIICPDHSEFSQSPSNHLHKSRHQGCPECAQIDRIKALTKTNEKFIEEIGSIHGDKYDLSNCEYINSLIPVCIGCKIHGKFYMAPKVLLRGANCQMCAIEDRSKKKKLTKKDIIKRATKIRNDTDYSLFEYNGLYINSKFKCLNCEQIYEQLPCNHILGKIGCTLCKVNSKLNNNIAKVLIELGYPCDKYSEYRLPNCKNIKPLPFDNGCNIIVSNNKTTLGLIEGEGLQHFFPQKFFGGLKRFTKQRKNDIIKNTYCLKKNIPLLRISYKECNYDLIKKLIETFINRIKNGFTGIMYSNPKLFKTVSSNYHIN